MNFDNTFTLLPVYNSIMSDREKHFWIQNMIDNCENVVYYNILEKGETIRIGRITEIYRFQEELKGKIEFYKNYHSSLCLFLLLSKIGSIEIYERKEFNLRHPFDPQSRVEQRVFGWNVIHKEIDHYKWLLNYKRPQKN